jgi:hypothetical protein
MGLAIFCGDFSDPDPDRDCVLDVDLAYAELRGAGFDVLRLPAHFRMWLHNPLDDFLEVRWVGSDDPEAISDIWAEIEAIVAPYGGYADSFGPMELDHVPFADLFRDT